MAGSDLLVWLDMEMTGLDPGKERIIELAAIVTDGHLTEVEGACLELVIHQPEDVLDAMDDWNREHHNKSGLRERVKASTIEDPQAEQQMLDLLDRYFKSSRDRPVLAGNSIHQDRRFIRRYMPRLDARLHYRMVDVSTIKELARRWYPEEIKKQQPKKDTHRALEDIRESIDELRYYRAHVFAAPPPPPASVPTTPASVPTTPPSSDA